MVVVYHAFSFSLLRYLIPAYLIIVPYLLQGRLNIRFNLRDILWGAAASILLVLPFVFVISASGRPAFPVSAMTVALQAFGVSFPEEAYFRGFLQERLGNNVKALVLVSGLFAALHLPQLFFYGNLLSVLTFFPSLVMGYLYLKTGNVLPGAIFHFCSNLIYFSFYGTA